jgi:hypothetical protein
MKAPLEILRIREEMWEVKVIVLVNWEILIKKEVIHIHKIQKIFSNNQITRIE